MKRLKIRFNPRPYHGLTLSNSLVHEKGSISPKFGAVFQVRYDDAGQSLLNSEMVAGFFTLTHLHAVGDGAPGNSGFRERIVWFTRQLSH